VSIPRYSFLSSSEPPRASGADASPLALSDVVIPGAAPGELLLDDAARRGRSARPAVLLGTWTFMSPSSHAF
jgi:hypothetical protein